MRVRLDYGADGLDVDVPDERVTVIEPRFRPSLEDPRAALLAALRAPIDAPPLGELAARGGTVAISVCDITRAQPPREMRDAVVEESPAARDADRAILLRTASTPV